jgi:NitT/TauT family transport system permease protein
VVTAPEDVVRSRVEPDSAGRSAKVTENIGPGTREETSNGERRTRSWNWVYGLLAGVIVLGGWELASLRFPDYLLPGVPATSKETLNVLQESHADILKTLQRLLIAMGISIVGGWAVGLIMANATVGRIVNPILKIGSAVPFVSWTLLAVLWFGGIEFRVTFVCVVLVLPVFATHVYEGVRAFDPELVQAVRQFGPSWWQFMRYVLIPNSFADVLLTLKSMTGFALRILVFAELVGANSGVGHLMSQAQSNFRIDQLLALTIVMVLMTLALLAITSILERYLLRWRPTGGMA